jgi:two-component system phosphate regulon sensor histidine kinase PhoR
LKRIFTKIFGGYILLTFILISLILGLSYPTIRSYYIETQAENLSRLNSSLQSTIRPQLKDRTKEEIDRFVKEIGSEISTRITVIARDGKVLADSEEDPAVMENHGKRPEIMEAFQDHKGKSLRYSTTVKSEMLYVAKPVKVDGEVVAVLRVSIFLREIETLTKNLVFNIVQVVLIVALLTMVGVYLFSRSISYPIKSLAMAARRVAAGDFDVKVRLRNKDEIKDLASSFNYMTAEIKNLFNEISMKKDELNSIISSLRDGLVVIDSDGVIMLVNEGFRTIAKSKKNDSLEGKHYSDVINNKGFRKVVKQVNKKKQWVTREIQLGSSYFFASANWIDSKEEIVVILYDVSEHKKLELIKRDFVTNVSHELRTPLTAIKGFTETLEFEIDEDNRRYIEIIQRHTNRLINIVEDLLQLSNLENAADAIEISEVDLDNLFVNVHRIFEDRFKKKKLEFRWTLQDGYFKIPGDPFKMEQVFINLVDNAIKYTDEGGIYIDCSVVDEEMTINVYDTGLGIPKEQHDRIFERFFVVDKSRSRKLGGTGLGLSIVKHIVLLHGGNIDIDRKYKNGTSFIITLPLTKNQMIQPGN